MHTIWFIPVTSYKRSLLITFPDLSLFLKQNPGNSAHQIKENIIPILIGKGLYLIKKMTPTSSMNRDVMRKTIKQT